MSTLRRAKCRKEANGMEKSVTRLYNTLISATRRNKEFSLTLLYINNLMKHSVCAYTGVKFSDDPLSPDYMTLERIDNSKGYVDGNVIPVRQVINTLRGSKSMSDLINQLNQERNKLELLKSEIGKNSDKFDIINNLFSSNKQIVECVNGVKNANSRINNCEKELLKVKLKREKANNYLILKPHEESILSSISKSQIKKANNEKTIDDFLNKNYYSLPEEERNSSTIIKGSQQKIKNLEDLIEGIVKFENLTWKEKQCVSVGIPLNSSLKVLLKSKLAYNIIGG